MLYLIYDDISRSARDITQRMQSLADQLPNQSNNFARRLLRIAFKFAREPQTEDVIENIYKDAISNETEDSNSSSSLCSELSLTNVEKFFFMEKPSYEGESFLSVF